MTLYFTFMYLNSNCMINQKIKAKPKVKGAILRKKFLFLLIGTIISFVNNFTASAKGCKIPKNPTLLGPFRSCLNDRNLRSSKVKNATERRAKRKVTTKIIILNIV